MTMRINTIVTHLRAEDACTIIEFLDQLRAMLVQTYGKEIKIMLQEALQPEVLQEDEHGDEF